ncbi:MAG: hypothetical protein ACRC4M_03135, partial [Mycoplasma sp.]
YYDETGYLQTNDLLPKTFETTINLSQVSAPSRIVERSKIPSGLEPETLSNFILKKESPESELEVNVENLNKLFKINELFPMLATVPELLKETIVEDTSFRITDNALSIDGKKVTFFLEANQIWNNSGFFERMPEDSWASFRVEFEFPGANATWVIIGSSIGGAALLFLVILSLCNKAKFKALITNKF